MCIYVYMTIYMFSYWGCDTHTHAPALDSSYHKCVEQMRTAGSAYDFSGQGYGYEYMYVCISLSLSLCMYIYIYM